jgi:UDP-2-acetamido-3-amino-2,3-dideoxy-glucuronate N-acetyltransferase
MNVNVIGCGNWAENHIRILSSKKLLNGIYDINKKKSYQIAKKYNCKILDKEELKKPKKNTCLFILSSANSHFNLLKKFIPIYKNIFVEKPLVEELKEFNIIKKISDKHKNKIVVGHIINYHPVFIELKKFLRKKKIGKIFGFKSLRHNFGRYRSNEDVIQSLSIHDISIQLNLAKLLKLKLKKYSVKNFSFFKKKHFDESRLFLYFDKHVQSIVSSSWISPIKTHILQINSNKGILVFDDTQHDLDKKLFIQYFKKNGENLEKNKKEYFDIKNKITPLENEIITTIKYFSNLQKSVPTTLEESYQILKIIDKIRKN